jgi:hypothetical protein
MTLLTDDGMLISINLSNPKIVEIQIKADDEGQDEGRAIYLDENESAAIIASLKRIFRKE